MKVFVTMKSLAKRKNYLTSKEFNLNDSVGTLRELLKELVTMEVERFNSIAPGERLVGFFTEKEVKDQRESGKISFSSVYEERKADWQLSVEVCIQSFVDGLFRVFLNEREVMELDKPLFIQNGDQLTFIRLTMLAGRMW